MCDPIVQPRQAQPKTWGKGGGIEGLADAISDRGYLQHLAEPLVHRSEKSGRRAHEADWHVRHASLSAERVFV